MAERLCTVDGCDRAARARGLCKKHLARLYRTGSVDIVRRSTPRPHRTPSVDIARLAATNPIPGWERYAACADTRRFYPGRGVPTAALKAICERCPVRYACLKTGLNEPAGIWGGTSGRQRRDVIRPALRHHLEHATAVTKPRRTAPSASTGSNEERPIA